MDNQEIFNQIRELQKQRTLLSAQDAALVNKINELRDKIALKNIKKGYYTDNNGLYCKVYDIKEDVIFVYEVNTSELCATLSLTLFFHMEKKDGTYDNREVYVHGFPIKL